MHELSLWVDTNARPVRVVAAGDLDLDGGDRLEAVVGRLAETGHAEIALDLSAVAFMDSSGLGAVISVAQGAVARGWGHVVLEDASPAVLRVLELTGTTDVVDLGLAAKVRGDLAHVWQGPSAVA